MLYHGIIVDTDTDTDTDNFFIFSSGVYIVKYILKCWNNQQLKLSYKRETDIYIMITVVLVSYTHFTIIFYISLFRELGFRIYGCVIIIIHNQNMKGLTMNKSIPSQILFVKYGPAFNKHIMAGFSYECTILNVFFRHIFNFIMYKF